VVLATFILIYFRCVDYFRSLTLLVGRQEGHPAYKKIKWWCAGMVICLERGADLHMAKRIPLPLTVSCSSKIQIGFTFLVPAHPGSPGQRAVKRVCVCADVCASEIIGAQQISAIMLVAWNSGRTSVSDWRTFPVLRSTCS